MIHCTVCGAAAREGAKFCTSCGARLVDTVPVDPSPDATATVPAASEPLDTAVPEATAPEAGTDQPSAEAAWTSTVTGDATGEVEIVPAEPEEPAGSEADAPPDVLAATADEPEYAASWPSDDAAPATTAGAPEAGPAAVEDATWASWTSATEAPVTEVRDAGAEEGRPDEAVVAPAAADADEGIEESHHGASDWESWSPVAAGESVVSTHAGHADEAAAPAHASDAAASVRRLLDDLANRIDRLIAPATLASRDVDPDALADQLERWSRPAQGSADLLEVVQAVRKAPRDLDAIGQLADRAADLELLVRHYQAITTGAGEWARELRARKGGGSGEA